MKRIIIWLCLAFGVHVSARADEKIVREPFTLDALLARDDLWAIAPTNLGPVVRGGGFTWLDPQKTTAQGGQWQRLRFLELPVWEAVIRFASNHVGRIELLFYNHGDAGDLGAADFDKLVNRTIKALSAWTATNGVALPELAGAAHTKIQRAGWTRAPTRLELEWSATQPHMQGSKQVGYRSEFIRLKLLPMSAPTNAAPAKLATPQTVFALRKRVQSRDDGDVLIPDVPMVDQGFKGYCAAAVIARLMRYYGKDFDQHDAAQLAGTTAQEGTKNLNMKDALKRLALQGGLQFQAAQEVELQRLVTDYNLAAALARKPKVALSHNLDALISNMDKDLLRQVRGKKQTVATAFKDLVSKNIATGVPVVWHVYLGLFAEPGMWPMRGAHARLIIGYNKKTGDILYTDTWGHGHELKRMDLDEAVTITLGLYIVKPNNA